MVHTSRDSSTSDDAPASETPPRNSWGPVWQFAVKIVIAGAVVTYCLSYLIDYAVSDVNGMIDARINQLRFELRTHADQYGDKLASNFTGRAFWERLQKGIERAAAPENALPPDQQQKLLQDVRVLTDRARPFILEAETAFTAQPTDKPAPAK